MTAVTQPRWTEYRRLSDLPPAESNPKTHDVAAVRASIRQHGYIESSATADRGAVTYEVGDSREVLRHLDQPFDAVLTCPPYLSLERYSDDPNDLSTMNVGSFRVAVREILRGTFDLLRPDRFAVWVVGLVRLPGGRGLVDLRALVADEARAVGFTPHNHAVLVTPIGSLAVRAPRQFTDHRYLGHTYQDVVVLVKGDARKAAAHCGHVDVADPAELGMTGEDDE